MGCNEHVPGQDYGGGALIKALIIEAEGKAPFIKDVPSQKETYEVIKATITSPYGNWFDRVCKETFHGYVNDTGIIDGLPLNPVASILLGQVVCGDVIIFGTYTPTGEWDGEEHDVPQCVIESVKKQWSLLNANVDARNDRRELEDVDQTATQSPSLDEVLEWLRLRNVSSEVSQ